MPVAIPIAANSLWEVRLNGFVDNQQLINTYHYLNLDPVADVILAGFELAQSFGLDVWTAWIKPALSTQYENAYIDAQCIRPIRYRSFRYIPGARTGSVAGDCSPSGVAAVVRRQKVQSGRANQGRVYYGGLAESSTVQSAVSAAWFAANEQNLKDSVTESVVTPTYGEFMAVLYHPGAVTTADEIVIGKVDTLIRYQRRREVGVGI